MNKYGELTVEGETYKVRIERATREWEGSELVEVELLYDGKGDPLKRLLSECNFGEEYLEGEKWDTKKKRTSTI